MITDDDGAKCVAASLGKPCGVPRVRHICVHADSLELACQPAAWCAPASDPAAPCVARVAHLHGHTVWTNLRHTESCKAWSSSISDCTQIPATALTTMRRTYTTSRTARSIRNAATLTMCAVYMLTAAATAAPPAAAVQQHAPGPALPACL
jgi:hypothetical protein